MKKCKAKRANGTPCTANAGVSGFCFAHDPALGRKRASARKLGGHNRRRSANDSPFPACDVQSAIGLAAFCEAVMRETWTLERGVARSRTLGYLAQVQKGILEIGEIETRLAALEAAFGVRAGTEKK
jgi:hypothetical protein